MSNLTYQVHQLSDRDQLEGHILSPTQTAVIQNLRMQTVEQKLALAPSMDSKETYWQQEAYLRGQLDAYNHLLTASDVAQSEVASQLS